MYSSVGGTIEAATPKSKEKNTVPKGGGERPIRRRSGPRPDAWFYGQHTVLAALANQERDVRRLLSSGTPPELSAFRSDLTVESCGRAAIEKLLPPGAVHQGLAALVDPLPAWTVEEVRDAARNLPSSLVLMLDQVSDPHNVGAIMRSAAVFGVDAVIVQDRHAPEITGALAKAASGALEAVPMVRTTNLVRALETLKAAGFWCLGLDADADRPIGEIAAADHRVLVLGAEGAGLRRLTREACDDLARIDSEGAITSLNVSNAAAVALYALSRRAPGT